MKTLSPENLEKLKKSILKYGFTAPGFVWKSGKKLYIMDAHQRVRALGSLFSEGYEIPDIPIVYIQAKNKKEAKEKLLHITSQYGEFNRGELDNYLIDIGSDEELLNTIRLMDGVVVLEHDERSYDEFFTENETEKETAGKTMICPHCGETIEL